MMLKEEVVTFASISGKLIFDERLMLCVITTRH